MKAFWARALPSAALAFALAAACSSEEGGGNSSNSGAVFGDSDCFSCVSQACQQSRSDCAADPECASYLTCVKACPSGDNGLADVACAGDCPAVSGSTAVAARNALEQCFASSAPSCSSCGAGGTSGADSGQCPFTEPALCDQCAPSGSADDCVACTREECCESDDAVFSLASQLGSCWANCSDYACEKQCYAMYPDQITYLGAWISCREVKCKARGICSKPPACMQCALNECPNERARCWSNPDCYQIAVCVDNCGVDKTCGVACVGAYPGGAFDFEAVASCSVQKCASQCGG